MTIALNNATGIRVELPNGTNEYMRYEHTPGAVGSTAYIEVYHDNPDGSTIVALIEVLQEADGRYLISMTEACSAFTSRMTARPDESQRRRIG